jgi:2-polyprenyl-6-methoxyphenol hydroxylase-like FAD-dependent oxidoreductase
MRPLDVGIIGAGTAGSAAAVFLARAGHRVTVYERVPEPGPVGAGITLQPTGLHVLCRLGLYTTVVSRGARLDRLLCETTSGRPLVSLSYETVGRDLFGLGVHRGVLFEALWSALRTTSATVRTGVEIVDLARAGKRGRWFVDVHRERHGPHELVIVADGARSQLRDDTGTSQRIARYPWGALWFVGRETRGVRASRRLHQVCDGNQRFLGFLPTGKGPRARRANGSAGAGDGDLVSLFYSLHGDRLDAWREGGLDAWKDDIRSLTRGRIDPEGILVQIERLDDVLFATYHDVVMHRWSTRDVVYLGDAAHATSPQLGQGANLALWDAMSLAAALDAESRDLALALDRYTRGRRDHLAFYQFATRWLTPFFQGDQPLLGSLRDLAMPLMTRFPMTNRIMTLAMLGVLDGFTGKTLALRLPKA